MTKALSRFAEWLLNALWKIGIVVANAAVDVINAAIVVVASTFGVLVDILPDASLVMIPLVPPPALISFASNVNWFVPMDAIAGGLGLIILTYTAYFAIRPVAKFMQVA